MTTITKYLSSDGIEFGDQQSCVEHELILSVQVLLGTLQAAAPGTVITAYNQAITAVSASLASATAAVAAQNASAPATGG